MSGPIPGQVVLGSMRKLAEHEPGEQASKQLCSPFPTSIPALPSPSESQ